MTPLSSTIEVDRPPAEVFAYVTDPSRFHEWQDGVVSGGMEGDGPAAVGAKCLTTRRIGFAERVSTSEVTVVDPPARWGVRGIDGPVRATVDVLVEALDGGGRSRLTIDLEFEGHGIGKVLVPLVVRRKAEKEMPENLRRLKGKLEASGAS